MPWDVNNTLQAPVDFWKKGPIPKAIIITQKMSLKTSLVNLKIVIEMEKKRLNTSSKTKVLFL